MVFCSLLQCIITCLALPNSVDMPTLVHLHSMASLPQYDGHAEDLTNPGLYNGVTTVQEVLRVNTPASK